MSSVASVSSRVPASIRRELLLCGLNKLEDRDTLKSAVDELNAIIHVVSCDALQFVTVLLLGSGCSRGVGIGVVLV